MARGGNQRNSRSNIARSGIEHRATAPMPAAAPSRSMTAMRSSVRRWALAGPWFHLDQMLSGIEAVEVELRNDGVPVRRKRGFFNQDPAPLRIGPKEADQHQMQVDGQRVHGHHLGRTRAHQIRERRGKQLVIADPRSLCIVMTENSQPPPVGQFLFDVVRRGLRAASPASGRRDTPFCGRSNRTDGGTPRRSRP